MKKKYVLKNKLRFTIFLITLIVTTVVGFLGTTVNGYKENTYFEVRVSKGDTLWEIATKNAKSGDVRKLIYKIKKINNLKDSVIYPGMILKIPDTD
ncbi:MAG TPA: LysM peptidoglycan-binding domain-containing protein [Clostridiaceae bacterium]|nr:LysM peptidoglycan-binding domain-containing protein [Clostridiaceae bacterium]